MEKYDISQKIEFKTGTYELNSDANFNFQLNRVIMWDGGDADEVAAVSQNIYGVIGIILITAFCLIGAFAAPQVAYWCMTPNAKKILEDHGISRKFSLKGKISLSILTLVIGVLYIITIISAGKQGVTSGMNFWQLTLRFVIFFWMISIFDAVVLDWWMFTKTKIFGILIKQKTGKPPEVWNVEPQWDGKELHKLIIEIFVSAMLALIFLKLLN